MNSVAYNAFSVADTVAMRLSDPSTHTVFSIITILKLAGCGRQWSICVQPTSLSELRTGNGFNAKGYRTIDPRCSKI